MHQIKRTYDLFPIFLTLFLFGLSSCFPTGHDFYLTQATVETQPVQSAMDAADDIAIWVHPQRPEKSLILGTDKQKGIEIYNLEGKTVASFPEGRINNLDIRQSIRMGRAAMDIVGGSNQSDNSLALYFFDGDSLRLTPVMDQPLRSGVSEVYGFCFYRSIINGFVYAYVVGTDGMVEQWLIQAGPDDRMNAQIVRQFDVGGQCEGMVADDENGIIYIAEERMGLWSFPAEPDQPAKAGRVDLLRANPDLAADLEGIAIYKGPSPEKGYLIVSSQGNSSFAVYQRKSPNVYIGSFRIEGNEELGIDAVNGTDGIDVTHLPLGPAFPYGLFVAQDDSNQGPELINHQNFKLVPWEKVAVAFKTPLYPANQ
jgi:3-phytase